MWKDMNNSRSNGDVEVRIVWKMTVHLSPFRNIDDVFAKILRRANERDLFSIARARRKLV